MKKYFIRIGAVAAVLTVMAVGLQTAHANAAPKCPKTVNVYSDAGYQGAYKGNFCSGADNLATFKGGVLNDQISSMTNHSSKTAYFYWDAKYCGEVFTLKPGQVHSFKAGARWNDKISSISVGKKLSCQR